MLWLSNVIPFAKTKWICLYILRADDKMLLLLLSLFLSLWCFVILVASFILDESHTHTRISFWTRARRAFMFQLLLFFFALCSENHPKYFINIQLIAVRLLYFHFINLLWHFYKLFRVWLRANTVSFICLLEKEKNFTKFPINTIHSDE